tara:strand:+ start:9011 stop:9265 length:255 start_codon:yes stop_codon:yes gene_type:complete
MASKHQQKSDTIGNNVNKKILEALLSFFLFGSGATGLMMIWVLIAEYKVDDWIVWPPVLLTVSIVMFFISWSILNLIKRKNNQE